MRTKHFWPMLPMLPMLALLAGCDDFGPLSLQEGSGELRWSLKTSQLTKVSAGELPDTNDFILSVRDAAGKILYEGSYGDSPQRMEVEPGKYVVGVQSGSFTGPAFDRPLYGDEQEVQVPGGQCVTVKLQCTLQNAGVRLQIAPEFLTCYPDGTLYVAQGNDKLLYKYRESRIAYLRPDRFSLLLHNAGQMETLLSRKLAVREILTLKIEAVEPRQSGQSRIHVQVDTSKTWTSDTFVIGGNNGEDQADDNHGEEPRDAISIGQAAAHAGENGIWLYGYIVGGDLTSAGKGVKTSQITKNTHFAVADRSSVTDKASCVAVELPKGAVRDALNLVDHPDLVGTRIYLKGNVVANYFGTTGFKGVTDYAKK